MAAANAELLERKKADAAQQAAEDRRIAAYLADKAARDQVHTRAHACIEGMRSGQGFGSFCGSDLGSCV